MTRAQYYRAWSLWRRFINRAKRDPWFGEEQLWRTAHAEGLAKTMYVVIRLSSDRSFVRDEITIIGQRLVYRDRHPRWKDGDPRGQGKLNLFGRLP